MMKCVCRRCVAHHLSFLFCTRFPTFTMKTFATSPRRLSLPTLLLVIVIAAASWGSSYGARPPTSGVVHTAGVSQRPQRFQPQSKGSLVPPIAFVGTQKKVAASAVPAVPAWKADVLHRLKVAFYFGLWYALNVVYNIVNKKVLNVWPAPVTVGSLQLGIGALYATFVWALGLRPRPVLPPGTAVHTMLKRVGLWHALGQLCTMASLGAGPVSFTHIVKALEPFFSAMVSALLLGQWMPLPVYLTLIPVVGGVGYACLKERSFSWLALNMAMLSNLSFALRAVLSKLAMSQAQQTPKRKPSRRSISAPAKAVPKNLSPPNVFGLVTIFAFFLSLPIVLLTEGNSVLDTLSAALEQKDAMSLAQSVLWSGLFHYLNNEVMYLALGSVHPITLAVGNTMKRVFILVASVLVFRNTITTQSVIGSAIGLTGVLLYSVTKQYYEQARAS